MGCIQINNIKLYAFHGCLEEEAKIGSKYRVDIKIKANLIKPSLSDELSDTVDYVHVNHIVREEMAIRSKLLENVAKRILDRIFRELKTVKKGTVSIAKINPPVEGNVNEVVVVLSKKRKI
ncbi:MAG: dihydroneopterin aldolase [Flavobacteriaceae bacterium]|nr:MAG: dihydroneopterin aldolase [Flavobacteriaceae bacterium]